MFSFPLLLLRVYISHAYHKHACLDELFCYLYITDMQQLCPFSLPFKFILYITSLSCGLLNTMFIRCLSYFSADFWTWLCPLSEDNHVSSGAMEPSVPLQDLKHTGCPTALLLKYPCCLFKARHVFPCRWQNIVKKMTCRTYNRNKFQLLQNTSSWMVTDSNASFATQLLIMHIHYKMTMLFNTDYNNLNSVLTYLVSYSMTRFTCFTSSWGSYTYDHHKVHTLYTIMRFIHLWPPQGSHALHHEAHMLNTITRFICTAPSQGSYGYHHHKVHILNTIMRFMCLTPSCGSDA